VSAQNTVAIVNVVLKHLYVCEKADGEHDLRFRVQPAEVAIARNRREALSDPNGRVGFCFHMHLVGKENAASLRAALVKEGFVDDSEEAP
jgi:hypothetical protein